MFVETTKPIISNSVRVYRYICGTFLTFVPRVGLLTPCFVSRAGFLYTMIFSGEEFLLPSSGGPGVCPGGMVLDEVDTCIKALGTNSEVHCT